MQTHQDWKPIIWEKKIPKSELPKSVSLSNAKKNINYTVNTVKKIYDPDNILAEPDIMPVLLDRDLSKEIQNRRLLKKMTQQQLANALSIPVSVINEYEKCVGIRNGKYISKIKKFLEI
jgi:ribosome-binding protein aMBF1 (putative translation factor)